MAVVSAAAGFDSLPALADECEVVAIRRFGLASDASVDGPDDVDVGAGVLASAGVTPGSVSPASGSGSESTVGAAEDGAGPGAGAGAGAGAGTGVRTGAGGCAGVGAGVGVGVGVGAGSSVGCGSGVSSSLGS